MSVDLAKPIVFSAHAREKMLDRGTTESEVEASIRTGNSEPARKGRMMYRKNFAFGDQWRGKRYAVKQVAPVIAEEADRLVVVTASNHDRPCHLRRSLEQAMRGEVAWLGPR